MHLTDVEHGVMGSYAIVGAHLPIALGAAWSAQYRGTGQVAVAFFGDGATNIGAFHEALNFAVVWRLPVVFVCENNLYMEYTPIADGDRGRAPGRRPGRRVRAGARSSSTATTPTRSTCTAAHFLRAGPRRRRAGADRGADLPHRRPLAGRPRQVPAGEPRSRRGPQYDPIALYRQRLLEASASPRPSSTAIDARGAAASRRGDRGGQGAPPSPARTG